MKFKSPTDITVLCHLLLLIGLGVSGSLSGIFSDIAYLCAFVLPTLLGLFLGKRIGKAPVSVKLQGREAALFLPIAFPSVLLIMGISLLTSFLLGLFGATNSVTVYDSFFENLIRHVILPAVLEESIFRYLPMTLFGGKNRRACILVSSLSFALVHANLFQIPYAFVAGVIFMSVNLMTGSPLPSFILHTLNNLVSVISLYFGGDAVILSVLALLAVISIVFVVIYNESYKDKILSIFSDKSKYKLSYSLILLVIPTLIMAILNLLG